MSLMPVLGRSGQEDQKLRVAYAIETMFQK